MTYELVVFDIAGTTLKDDEDVVAKSFKTALSKSGIHIEAEELNRFMGYRKIDAIRMILEEEEENVSDHVINAIHEEFLDLINQHYSTADIQEIEGASDVFKELRSQGIKIGINTGFSSTTTKIIATRLGWLENELVDATISSDEVAEGRPHADMIHSLMKTFEISSSKAVVKVGDTPSDLMEGKNADCGLTIGVLYGTHSRDELSAYPHDYLINDIKELNSILAENI
jgi:phosphonatase-like hydrolase